MNTPESADKKRKSPTGDLAAATPFPREILEHMHTILGPPPTSPLPLNSGINFDTDPIQLCISLSGTGARYRIIADPAPHISNPVERYEESLGSLDALCVSQGASWLLPRSKELLETVVPPRRSALLAPYQKGVLWLAAEGGGRGVAIYVGMGIHPEPGDWDRVQAWLLNSGISPQALQKALDWVPPEASLVSVGIEGRGEDAFRLKIYWRTEDVKWETPSVDKAERNAWAEALSQAGTLRPSGVTYGLGLSSTGEVIDTKMDLCACPRCFHRPLSQWKPLLSTRAEALGLDPTPILKILDGDGLDIALVGLAHRMDGQKRMNVYLKPIS